jgi:ATP-binding cassette subfamily F protein 3
MEHLKILDLECNGGKATENQMRRYLRSFGFSGGKATSKVAPFSGGEKSRLELALICYQRPNLLLLDEPTNNLDIDMRQALAVALQEYSEAVVLVLHGRHLLKVNSDKLMLVANGRATEFQGSVDDYPKWLTEHNRGNDLSDFDTPEADETPIENTACPKKEQKRLKAERRQRLQPLTNTIKRTERVMEKPDLEKQAIQRKLADNDLYNDENINQLRKLLTDQAYVQKELNTAEAQWLDASNAYGAAR